ncbi:Peroxisome assembly protein 12 [Monoraphidium neglectum]|uniref:Peroxisome biogenesis protein 12 n=1 Tax=Monoraphidium neglectum TaxID=145388 RepID=A0A0D2MD81_9CHLO|nr:Peroxisome assembly protein 12 [Monoraphidium neglectum]KIZ01135.1 Peroxisome assembly protein 12 [Monoraphidium neglectum]|eukprot:XP_013900154.1 Peroxisome assembly protein 12 [Monoraphidium neglectum]
MSFVSLGGDAGSKPTFFEVYAADKLVPSLRAAVIYSLSVFGQRRAWVQRLLEREDEVVALVVLLLDRHSLRALEGTFAESLYGLKRERWRPRPGAAAAAAPQQQPAGAAAGCGGGAPLGRGGASLALLCSVLLPYLQSKAERLYTRHAARAGVLGLALRRASPRLPPVRGGAAPGPLAAAWDAALALYVRAYPFLHAAIEASKFSYQLAYLLDASDYNSPMMRLLGQRLVRMSAPDMARLENEKQRARGARLAAVEQRGSRVARGVGRAWLRARFAVADHTSSALILAILEWWYASAEDRLAAGKAIPPPPAPPPPAPHPDGVGLPEDPATCPLCRRARVNPAALAVSGYVFCYPCVFGWVAQRRCCPVTRQPATLDHVRRLFEAL